MNINKKTFTLTNRVKKSFNIIISGFEAATTLLFRIRNKISISFVAALSSKIYTTITIKKIRLVISQMKLTTKMVQTINAKRISITYVMKQTMKSIVTIYGRVPIAFVSKARQKIVSVINQGRLTISADPTLATFYTLGDHDTKTLGEMDILTLGELDYEIA